MNKIVIFGIGSSYEDFKANYMSNEIDIVGYADNDSTKQGKYFNQQLVLAPEEICNCDFDYVIVTSKHCDEIEKQLVLLGIEKSKIVKYNSECSKTIGRSLNEDICKLREILCDNNIESLYPCNMRSLGRARRLKHYDEYEDYVRISSLELAAEEIYSKNIQGCVAELGVYRGEFASIINKVFPDRKIYLFDTFEGFSNLDIEIDDEMNYSKSKNTDFSNTSVQVVIDNMEYPDQCIVRKGLFPETAVGIEEQFVFVSIDADLYRPIYEGLQFFYPRMAEGGYIFIHDYNNIRFKGVKKAVIDFARENGIGFFPLSDFAGSAVIVK